MKFLAGLSLLQACLLLFLGAKTLGLETQTTELKEAVEEITARETFAARPGSDFAASNATPPADIIRLIMREELSAIAPFEGETGASRERAADASLPTTNPGVVFGEQARTEETAILRELDVFIGSGHMSEAEMAAMQMRIGRLPPTERRRAIAKMIKAIDGGKLDAQL